MRGQHFVLGPKFKKLDSFFIRLAFENIQVFDHKLIFFRPSNSQPRLFLVKVCISLPKISQSTYTAWIEQIKYLFVIDLKKRTENTYVLRWFFFFCLVYLIKQIGYTSLCYSVRLSVRVFGTFHSESFSTTGLTVGEDGSVISFDNLSDETGNAEAVIHIVLIMFLVEDLIKVVDLSSSEVTLHGVVHLVITITVGNLYLIIVVRKYFALLMPCAFLMTKQRPNSDSDFDFTSTVVLVFYFGWAQSPLSFQSVGLYGCSIYWLVPYQIHY